MRKINIHKIPGSASELEVFATDEKGPGGANHRYVITERQDLPGVEIAFQKGPIGEVGVNGLTSEALLAILIDRHKGFASGPYPSRENSLALTKLEEGLHWLQARTRDRIARDVEGKSVA